MLKATGVLVHTNLGRAPLADAAVAAIEAIARAYSTAETAAPLAGNLQQQGLQQQGLLQLGQRPRRARGGGGVGGHPPLCQRE